MSDSEEEKFCFFGKALVPYDEDAFPKKKPISVEDQIATDAQGRRRFHGAFTGGFSAGFFNTVGSLEGWKPSEFKSSRSEKAQNSRQRPEDYMDEEDRSEFGIAPEIVRTTSEYENKTKRKRQRAFADGPIPGVPVLHTLLESGNETVGYLLLKNIGLKQKNDDKDASSSRTYGCEMPSKYEVSRTYPTAEIPEAYLNYIKSPKDNSFGMGYVGLAKSHINLFQSSGIVSKEKNKKGFSIKGQAFGVGAFEEDDDDIYAREDMSNYDFEMTAEKAKKQLSIEGKKNMIHDTFVLSRTPLINKTKFPPPTIPVTFTGKHKVRGSRWDNKNKDTPPEKSVERKDMNTLVRSRYLGEETENINFTESGTATLSHNKKEDSSTNECCRNDSNDFANSSSNSSGTSGPSSSTNPAFLNLLDDKFVTASSSDDHTDLMAPVERIGTIHGTKEMRDAAKMKMFGPLTRTILTWQPNSLVCRRFNVPEPKFGDVPKKERKKTQLIFEYQKQAEENTPLQPGLHIKKEPDESNEDASKEESPNSHDISRNEISMQNQNLSNTVEQVSTIKVENSSIPSTSNNANRTSTQQLDVAPALDETEKVDVAKNIDLFKAVFMSSSEDESEEENEQTEKETTENNKRNELIKANVLGETLIPKIQTTKQGILSNVDFSKITYVPPSKRHEFKKQNTCQSTIPEKPLEVNTQDQNEKISNSEPQPGPQPEKSVDENIYGPKLPDRIVGIQKVITLSNSSSSEDEWVEKDISTKKKSQKHKKKVVEISDTSSDDDRSEKYRKEKKKSHKHKKKQKKEKKKKHKKDKR